MTLRHSNFNPRPPRGGRPGSWGLSSSGTSHFNPRPPRGGRRYRLQRHCRDHGISIHALLAEGDVVSAVKGFGIPLFQSTPSSRRATPLRSACGRRIPFQSTPSSRRATCGMMMSVPSKWPFQSTPSSRRATSEGGPAQGDGAISIHALLAEGDLRTPAFYRWTYLTFQSTPSSRRATASGLAASARMEFQSTPSSRRATVNTPEADVEEVISIHALLAEGDSRRFRSLPSNANFNPRPPRGGRHSRGARCCSHRCHFNPRPPRGGRRRNGRLGCGGEHISIHALLAEGDR